MNVNVEFSTDNNKHFNSILKETKNNTALLQYLAQTPPEGQVPFVSANNLIIDTLLPRTQWDFENFLTQLFEKTLNTATAPTDAIFFGDLGTGDEKEDQSSATSEIFNQLYALALKSKMDKFVKNNFRDYEHLMNGYFSHSEVFFYEIEKWSSDNNGNLNEKLQVFLVPNSEKEIIDFFDTQVKYGKFYVYRIFVHNIVLGTEYSYTRGGTIDIAEDKFASINIDMTPSIKVIRVPYNNVNESQIITNTTSQGEVQIVQTLPGAEELPSPHKTTIVLDSPPLPPEIEIVPILNQPHDLIFNIKDKLGSEFIFPNYIGQFDSFQYSTTLKSQLDNRVNLSFDEESRLDIETNKIFFNSDEPTESYEIYSLNYQPTTFKEFDGNMLTEVKGPNNSIILSLPYNQKKYFTFRAIDYHDNMSTPTNVYQVEIKENSGAVYPVIELLDLEEGKTKKLNDNTEQITEKTKTGKRFVLLKLNEQQSYYEPPEDASSAFEVKDVALGVAENSAFNSDKKFKIRIKSKKTGKMVDINLNFDFEYSKIITK